MSTQRDRPCPRCLLDEVPGAEALAALNRQWIDALPEISRAGESVYQKRLSACRACEHLAGGSCGESRITRSNMTKKRRRRTGPCPGAGIIMSETISKLRKKYEYDIIV